MRMERLPNCVVCDAAGEPVTGTSPTDCSTNHVCQEFTINSICWGDTANTHSAPQTTIQRLCNVEYQVVDCLLTWTHP